MSIRSASANGSRASAVRTAPGGSRPRVLERQSHASGSLTHLPSLGVTGSSFHRATTNVPGASLKPPGLPMSSTAYNSRRGGNADAKDNKETAVITIDDLQRLREQCGIGGAKTEMETDVEWRTKEKKDLFEKSRQRIKNWPNTLENLRTKRIEDKYRKLEDEEVNLTDNNLTYCLNSLREDVLMLKKMH